MSIDNARASAITWKRESLDKLRKTREVVREFKDNLSKLCGSVKAAVKGVEQGGARLAKQYDKYLNDESETYEDDANAMDALNEVPSIDEYADDTKLQAGESLEGLLAQLDETIEAVQGIKL